MSNRRATTLSLDSDLLERAKQRDIDVSRAAEEGIAAALGRSDAEQWKAENLEAMQNMDRWVAENGLPLSQFRPFS